MEGIHIVAFAEEEDAGETNITIKHIKSISMISNHEYFPRMVK